MSRWAEDPDAAADALIARSLDAIDLSGQILLANPSSRLPVLLQQRGVRFTRWDRRLGKAGTAEPWPPAGPFDLAIVRLAKARDEQDMTAHAVLSVLSPGGKFLLYGGNDEGIRSAARCLGQLCGDVETVATRGHGRVVAATSASGLQVRARLSDWRIVFPLGIGGRRRDWVSYPGIFSATRLDEGTALLVGALPQFAADARVLDFGCGSGVIGAAAMAAEQDITLVLMDSDSTALAAARENVPASSPILGTSLADAGSTLYHAILSNPPLHEGIAESHAALERLVGEAPAHLRQGGMLQVVVQRRVPLDRLLSRDLSEVSIPAENGRYRVWRARRA